MNRGPGLCSVTGFMTVSAEPAPPIAPRLLNMRQAAAYLGVSYWSLRDYVLVRLIPAVELPPLRAREGDRARKTLRRVLVDRADLDAFIDARKRGCSQDIESDAPQDQAGNTGRIESVCPQCARRQRPTGLANTCREIERKRSGRRE